MDPLSDVLSLLRPRRYGAGGFDVGGDWSVGFPAHAGVKCYALASGECWLVLDGAESPTHLVMGDCFLLTSGRPFQLTSDPALPPVDFMALRHARDGGVGVINGGGDCFLVGGHFALAGEHSGVLLGALAPIIHIREDAGKSALRWSLERMRQELREAQPGSHLVGQHLAHMMLVQALRLHLAAGPSAGVGWLFALADPRLRVAIAAMHEDPARRWTVRELGARAGMSRSTFALRFKQRAGMSPIEYLTRWRMLLAGDRLVTSGEPVSAVAPSLGYESESAFSTAFKRVMGWPPREYVRRRTRAR